MLVRAFIEQERAQRSDLVVLQGRCYDSETVSIGALDSLIDNLSRYWRQLPPPRII